MKTPLGTETVNRYPPLGHPLRAELIKAGALRPVTEQERALLREATPMRRRGPDETVYPFPVDTFDAAGRPSGAKTDVPIVKEKT